MHVFAFADGEKKDAVDGSVDDSTSDTEEEIDVVDKSENVPSKCKIDKYLEDIKKPIKKEKTSPKSFQAAFESLVAAKGQSFFLGSKKEKTPKKRKSEEGAMDESNGDPSKIQTTSVISPPKRSRELSGDKKKPKQSPPSLGYPFMPLTHEGSSSSSDKDSDFNRLNFLMPTIRWIKQQQMLQNCTTTKPGSSNLQMPSPFSHPAMDHLSFSDLSKASVKKENEIIVYPQGVMVPKQAHSSPISPRTHPTHAQGSPMLVSPKSRGNVSPRGIEAHSKLGFVPKGVSISTEHQYCNKNLDTKQQVLDLSVNTDVLTNDQLEKSSPLFRSLITGEMPVVSTEITVATATIKQENTSSTSNPTCSQPESTTVSSSVGSSSTCVVVGSSTCEISENSDSNVVNELGQAGPAVSLNSSASETPVTVPIGVSTAVSTPPMKLTGSQQDLFSSMNQAFELATNILNKKTEEIDSNVKNTNVTQTIANSQQTSIDQKKPTQIKIIHQQPKVAGHSLLSPGSSTLTSPPRLVQQTPLPQQTTGRSATIISPRSQTVVQGQRTAFSNLGHVVQNPVQLGSSVIPGQNIMLQQNTSQQQTFLVSIPVMTTSGTGAPSTPTTTISSTRASQVNSLVGTVNKGANDGKTIIIHQPKTTNSMTVNQLLKASREKAAAKNNANVTGNTNTIIVSAGSPIVIGSKVVQVQPTLCLNSQLPTSSQTKTVNVVNVIPTPTQKSVSYILTPSTSTVQGNQVINVGGNSITIAKSNVTSSLQSSTVQTSSSTVASKPATTVVNVGSVISPSVIKSGSLLTKQAPQFGGSPQFGTTQFLLQGVTQIHPTPSKHFQVDSKTPLFQSIVSKTPSQAISLAKSVNSASNPNSANKPPIAASASQSAQSTVTSSKSLDTDNDQAYGAIVSPNKVLQLVPQPIVPISQPSKGKASSDSVEGTSHVSLVAKEVDSCNKDKKEKSSPKKSLYKGSANGELLQTLVAATSYSSFSGSGAKSKVKRSESAEGSSMDESPKKVGD